MTIYEIENLTAAQLKERKAELVEVAKEFPVDDLAARYVQARMDAKIRDEKLAEQGKTITRLESELDGERKAAKHLVDKLAKLKEE